MSDEARGNLDVEAALDRAIGCEGPAARSLGYEILRLRREYGIAVENMHTAISGGEHTRRVLEGMNAEALSKAKQHCDELTAEIEHLRGALRSIDQLLQANTRCKLSGRATLAQLHGIFRKRRRKPRTKTGTVP